MDNRCIAHEKHAVSRCKVCLKPLCEECELKSEEGTFCGAVCRDKYRSARTVWDKVSEQEKSTEQQDKLRRFNSHIVRLLTYALIAVALIIIWEIIPEQLKSKLLNVSKELLESRGERH